MIVFALVAFSQFLSIGWRDRELQIASGLGEVDKIELHGVISWIERMSVCGGAPN